MAGNTFDGGDDNESGDAPDNTLRDERKRDNFLRLLAFLLDRFVEENQVAQERRHLIPPAHVLNWLRDLDDEARAALLEACDDADGETFGQAVELSRTSVGALVLAEVWPTVLLLHREKLRVPVRTVVLGMTVHFADDTVLVLSSTVPAQAVSEPIDDALLCAILRETSQALERVLLARPLDSLREGRAVDGGGAEGYSFFMGTVLQAIYNLDEPKRRRCMGWFRTAQQLLMPPLPPGALASMANSRDEYLIQRERLLTQEGERQAAEAEGRDYEPPPTPPPEPRSGWDEG